MTTHPSGCRHLHQISLLRDVSAAGRRRSQFKQFKQMQQSGRRTKPAIPPTDPENEEFVIFVRCEQRPQWLPVTIVKGGNAANALVKQMKGGVGSGPLGTTLKNNIGKVR